MLANPDREHARPDVVVAARSDEECGAAAPSGISARGWREALRRTVLRVVERRLLGEDLRPRSTRLASSSRSIRATSVSVVTPGSSSATSFTRHTSFGTGPRSPVSQDATGAEPEPPTGLHALGSDCAHKRIASSAAMARWRSYKRGATPDTPVTCSSAASDELCWNLGDGLIRRRSALACW